jgi:hypothetical protein
MESWSWLGDVWVTTMFMQGSGPSGVHGLGGLLESFEACRRSIGHTSWSALAFGALLADDITLELDMCFLECNAPQCVPTFVFVGCL